MRKYWIIYVWLLCPVCVWGQSLMSEVIQTMPDSLLPYLDAGKRTELIDFYHMGVEARTINKLEEGTVLDTLTNGYAALSLSESSRLQLLLLPNEESDTMICAVHTFLGEAPESSVSFYTRDWRKLEAANFISPVSAQSMMVRPDTMSVEQYDSLLKTIDPVMMAAQLSATDLTLTWTISTPMLNEKEKKALEAILLQRKLKWNGKRFN